MSRPSTLGVLSLLAESGESGLLSGEISRSFDEPFSANARISTVNSVLRSQKGAKRVREGPLEASRYYRNVPSHRWYITDTGLAYLEAGGRPGLALRREEGRARARTGAGKARSAAIAAVAGSGALNCRARRAARIKILRAAGLTLKETGGLLGISDEWVRRIIKDGQPGTRPCKCELCERK